MLLYGIHAVKAALENPRRKVLRVFLTKEHEKEFAKFFKKYNIQTKQRRELDKILPEGSVHQGIIADVDPLPYAHLEDILRQDDENATIAILDQVTDPHNVGAIIRSCAAFGITALVTTKDHAPQISGLVAKIACGGLEHLKLVEVVNLKRAIEDMKESGFWVYGLDERGDDIRQTDFSGKTGLVFGAEGKGLRRLTKESCDGLLRLPTQPPIGSLNVSNAVAVTLYAACTK